MPFAKNNYMVLQCTYMHAGTSIGIVQKMIFFIAIRSCFFAEQSGKKIARPRGFEVEPMAPV